MSAPPPAIRPLLPADIPALLDTWERQQARAAPNLPVGGKRPLPARRPIVERVLRDIVRADTGRIRALVAARGDAIAAYLLAREVRLPRDSSYRAYAPDHFLNSSLDDWGSADPADTDLLAALYVDLATWGLARGATGHILAVPAAAGDLAEPWLELGFARQDRYAFLPLAAARPGHDLVAIRRAGLADLDVATALVLAEAEHHHHAPIFAFAPPGLAAAKRRAMRDSLADPDAFIILAEGKGKVLGGLTAYFQADLPFWMPSTTPTPCAYIDSGFVDPAARGRGILRTIVSALAALIAPRDARGLFVTYLPANRLATRAWSGLGFRPLVTIHQRRLDPRAVAQLRHDSTATVLPDDDKGADASPRPA